MKSAGGKSNSTTKEDIHKEFFTACREGNLDMLLDSIENGVDVNLETGFVGGLGVAAIHGRLDVVKLLIQNGANVNTAQKGKATPLQLAVISGHIEIAKVLIQNGADVDAVNYYAFGTVLQTAAWHGHIEMVTMLLQNGADVNSRREGYGTALDDAVQGGHLVLRTPTYLLWS